MQQVSQRGGRLRRHLTATGIAAIALAVVPAPSLAGGCPPGKERVGARTTGPSKPVGVTDTVLGSVDLSKERIGAKDHLFRIRRLVIKPGGVVPWHQHGDRPALIYIIKGTIAEYNSKCTVPIVHRAGEASRESVGLSHWWRNNGRRTVVLISADILHTK